VAYDPKRIIDTANAFLLAAGRAMEQRPLGGNQFQMLPVPAVVCNAFAIELYLKALLTLEGSPSSGHDLSALFEKLQQPTRSVIHGRLKMNEADFAPQIAAVAKAFVEWRYIFEAGSIGVDLDFLVRLAKAAGDEALERLKTASHSSPSGAPG